MDFPGTNALILATLNDPSVGIELSSRGSFLPSLAQLCFLPFTVAKTAPWKHVLTHSTGSTGSRAVTVTVVVSTVGRLERGPAELKRAGEPRQHPTAELADHCILLIAEMPSVQRVFVSAIR